MPVGALVASQGSARQRVRAVLDPEIPPAPVPSSITVTPTPFSVAEGATVQLTATVYDQLGQEMVGEAVTWASSASGTASVNASTGLVTGVASGSCTITATASNGTNLSTGADCTVSPAVVASVDLTPTSLALTVGGSSATFTAQPRDASGNALAGRTVTAPSSDTNLATTSVNGYTVTVTPVAAGSPTVTATCETIASPTRTVTVTAAGTHPNEPGGYTRFVECGFAALPATTRGATNMTAGVGLCEGNGNQTIVSGKYQIRFPATLAAGTDPGNMRFSHDTGVNDPTDAFYLHIAGFRPGRSTADGGDDAYQNHQVDTKICHFKCFALGGGTGAAILRLLGQSPGNSLMQTFRVDVLSKQANIAYTQNVDATRRVTAGQDNEIEVQCVMNSAAGAADGIIKIWVNGVLVASHSNVVFKTASSGTVGFYDWWFEHTYGGTAGGAPPSGTRTRVDYWTYDSVYMSQP